MKAVKLNGTVCLYLDEALPEIYADRAVSFETYPEKPDGDAHLDILHGELVWVVVEPEPEGPEDENSVWDELDAAYQEGVDSV